MEPPGLPAWLVDNPFFVLGVPATATRVEISRAATRWLGLLELGAPGAGHFESPAGTRLRTTELVRASLAALQDPVSRAEAELWSTLADCQAAPSAALQPFEAPWLVISKGEDGKSG